MQIVQLDCLSSASGVFGFVSCTWPAWKRKKIGRFSLEIEVRECLLSFGEQNLLYSILKSENIKIKIHRIIIVPVVLYGCETWSLILREERRLRVFENMVLRRIFGRKRDEVTREWRKLHKDELSDFYGLPNIIRVMKLKK